MKALRIISFIVMLSMGACAQAVSTYGVKDTGAISKGPVTMYEYSFGSGGVRTVFLKSPDAGIEVVPYSVQISVSAGTLDDAMAFMEKAAGSKRISIQAVAYQGKTIGYLLTPDRSIVSKGYVEPYFFERGGKVYFSVFEKMYD